MSTATAVFATAPVAASHLSAARVAIERVSPCVDEGRFPARSVVGRWISIEADIFSDGHDQLAVELLWAAPGEDWQRTPMIEAGNDRWHMNVRPQRQGSHRYTLEAWVDVWGSYCRDLRKRVSASAVAAVDLEDGMERIRSVASDRDSTYLAALVRRLPSLSPDAILAALLDDGTAAAMRAAEPRHHLIRHDKELILEVERTAAAFASWYELFPRSQRADGLHASFDDVIGRLPMIAAMGFDVLYMPPIHPIGKTKRKGRNNSLQSQADDPGSPYAIGSADGGHDAVHPQLGGIEAFRRLRDAAASYDIEIALDFAIQCSPDHPWLTEHPGWFSWRSDGSLRCAENPPKKYEDIVNVDFYATQALPSLWLALRDVVEYWVGEGVRSFRVDNPHTKPLPFWEWMIADIRSRHPDVVFLSEAFTRPAMMYRLAKIGFSQSYTYFTWRNTRHELTEYLIELTQAAPRDFFRPHFFVNTPDINPVFLQTSGRPGFLIRAALATTLSGLWGMYSGFELCEAAALPGCEEYLDSEKYEIRARDWTAPGNIIAEITRLNHLRRQYPALQSHLDLRFQHCDNDQILCFAKQMAGDDTVILVAISLDPRHEQEGHFELPYDLLDARSLEVEELMTGESFIWRDALQHWRFVPWEMPFAIWRLRREGS